MKVVQLIKDLLKQESVKIDLMSSHAQLNHKFYQNLVEDFFQQCNAPHDRYPIISKMTQGVALCRMPLSKDQYFMTVDAAARRNYKKAENAGFYFKKIDYNNHLEEIWDIRRSTTVRQGEVSADFLATPPAQCKNPKSKSRLHDYPYFGVFSPTNKLVAYAGCFVCGELAMIEHIYGHAAYQTEGVVPKLIIDIGKFLYDAHPASIWYGYGTFYGASQEMQRFKAKFNFLPYRVRWSL